MGLPAELGRYEILGELAVGGMAEILLARRVGPSGFERPVVIKRILPHLSRLESFVSMFLDEARIAASIRHPNVIHVEELERDTDGLYLVMEYLEGESVSGLLRRLCVRDETLDRTLAAYIIAECCAGLHAAHEMVDADGHAQNVVHRDISPQNLFVTYDGRIKVLDFGIAKAADRITRTEAGQMKGKLAYMSPEQCDSKPLDRRSDIFSLGVVLYELSTGRRLFDRDNPLETVRAIGTQAAVVPPTRLDETYPPALERVCMRALSVSPDDRYQTMLEMRRDLHAIVHAPSDGSEPGEKLTQVMQTIFGERAAEKRATLQRLRAGSRPKNVPRGEVDEGVELARVPTDISASSQIAATIAQPSAQKGRRKTRRWMPIVLLALGVGTGTTLIRVSARQSASEHAASPVSLLASSTSGALSPSALSAAPSAPSIAADVGVHVDTRPSDVSVSIGGRDVGTTPLDLRIPRADAGVLLELHRDGYVSSTERIFTDHDQYLRIDLVPKTKVSRGSSPPAVAPISAKPNPWSKWH